MRGWNSPSNLQSTRPNQNTDIFIPNFWIKSRLSYMYRVMKVHPTKNYRKVVQKKIN